MFPYNRPPTARARRGGLRSGAIAGSLLLILTSTALAEEPKPPPSPESKTAPTETSTRELEQREASLLASASEKLSDRTMKSIDLLVHGRTVHLMDELTRTRDARSTVSEEIARRVDGRLAALRSDLRKADAP